MIPNILLEYLNHHFPNLVFTYNHDLDRIKIYYKDTGHFIGSITKGGDDVPRDTFWVVKDEDGDLINQPGIFDEDGFAIGHNFNWNWLRNWND